MRRLPRSCKLLAVILLPLISAPLFAAPAALLDSTSFEGPGSTAETLLHIQTLGRYALISQSNLGAKIDLIDRMAGTMASAGTASGVEASSGRVDTFLEPGEYKVRISKAASGKVDLSVRQYATANAGSDEWDVPILYDRQTVTGELHDFELLSYWVRIDAADPNLLVEMEGRSLAGAALWKDGIWDTGLRPVSRTYEPEPGKPLTTLEFSSRVDPGLYLLICVGGPQRQWAQESSSNMFSITRGGRYLGAAGIASVTFGPRGVESFLVSGNASFFQIEAKNNKGYLIGVAPNSSGSSRFAYRRTAGIDSKSASYRASISGGSGGATQWLTVQGPPGETVEMRWFATATSAQNDMYYVYEVRQGVAPSMLTVLGSAEGEESIDLTGLQVTATSTGTAFTVDPSNLETLEIGGTKALHRRINLLSSLWFVLRVNTAGSYGIFENAGSAAATYSFVLLDDLFAQEGVAPVEVKAGGRIQLQAKVYFVELAPTAATPKQSGAGILDFAIGDSASALSSTPPAPTNGLFWPTLSRGPGADSTSWLMIAKRGSIPFGISMRTLPLDLSEPAFIKVDPNASVQVPFKNTAAVRLFCTNSAFSAQTASIDGAPWAADLDIAAGAHQLTLTNSADAEQWYNIGSVPAAVMAAFERPKPAPLESLLPTFTEGSPLWRDFGRGELQSYLLTVAQPGSYRIATSGRLAMSITIRTPLKASLFSVSQNADGRNAVITSYLRPGTYLVQVRTQGNSQGRAGMVLQRMDVVSAGTLTDGAVLRSSVPAGALLKADLRIDREENYRLDCLGLGRSFAFRFEDADGWPIGQPTSSGTLSTRLAPGTYHYISAADQVQTRRLLSLQRIPDPARSAYDPKSKLVAMEPNKTYSKTWVEAEGRPADVFTFSVPAQIHALLYVSQGMLYTVLDSSGVVALSGTGGELGEADLSAGAWRIAVKAEEENNLKEYKILLAASELYDGAARALGTLPQSIPVSVGKAGTVELWSYGTQDIEATLLDSSSQTVAQGEAIPDDWNFRIVSNLASGRYTLVLRPPGSTAMPRAAAAGTTAATAGTSAQTRPTFTSVPSMSPPAPGASVVRLVSRPGIALAASSGSLETTVEIANEVVSTAFTPKASGVFRFDTGAGEPVSVSVSRKGVVLAAGVCPVFLPLAQGVPYDVRFWQSSGEKLKIVLRAGPEKSTDVAVAGADVAVDARDSVVKVTAALAAGMAIQPGGSGEVLYSPGTDVAFKPIAGESVGTLAGVGWVARADGSPVGPLTISPLVLGKDTARAFRVGAVPQSYSVTVPKKTVAVIRTDSAGRLIGVSASPAASFKPELYDWRGTSATPLTSALGLRDGAFRGKLWDAAAPEGVAGGVAGSGFGALPEGTAGVSASFYPVASESPLAMGQRVQVSVAARSAVSFTLGASRQSVRVSLESGMAAFAWVGGKPGGFLDARDDDTTGLLDAQAGWITVVNESGRPGLCTVEAMVSQAQATLTDTVSYESILGEPGTLSFSMAANKTGRIYLWGADPTGRFLREEDGKIYTGETSNTDYGPVVSFPSGTGILEVSASGALRIWSAKPEASRAAFVSKTAVARTSALGAAGAALGQAAEAWTFTVAKNAIVSLSAGTGGVTAIYNKAGTLVAVAAGERARTLLASLSAGTYTAFTRPLKGGAQSGLLRLQVLSPEVLTNEGEGAAVLMGPGEKKLYQFQVKAEGKVGAGIRTERDDLVATLFDQKFSRLDSGAIFIRSLGIGTYYLLVESPDATVRFSPLVYGLEGSRTVTPDDVIRSYTPD